MLNSQEDKAVHLWEIWLSKKVKRQMRTEESIVDQSHSKMEPSILDNGIQVSEMVLEVKCGQMVQDMKAIGNLIKLTVKENLSMLTEIFTRASGSTADSMEKASTGPMLTRNLAKVSGSKASVKVGQTTAPTELLPLSEPPLLNNGFVLKCRRIARF